MPEPKKDESKGEYMTRCVRQLVGTEGKKQAQAIAICNSLWDNKKKK